MPRLEGRVVATTRDGDPADPLTVALEAEGARVRVWPTLRFEGPSDPKPLVAAIAEITSFDWIAFTSARAVATVVARLPHPAPGVRVAAVGSATAKALHDAGWPTDVIGDAGGHALATAVAQAGPVAGVRVLFPSASKARRELVDAFMARSADVVQVEAYRTIPSPPPTERVRTDLEEGVDAVTFASPSAAESLATALGGDLVSALAGVGLVAIGPTTANALRAAGCADIVLAPTTTVRGLVEACVTLLGGDEG